jgi:phospholipase/carboxylesterase
MTLISSTLVHNVILPRKPAGEKYPAVLFLHGRGANEDDLLEISEYLDERLMCISARAPYPFPYGGGFTWYDLLEVGKPDLDMFNESYNALRAFIEDILKGYPIDPKKLFLFGFSMGTMMSYSIALTRPELICGVAANSGYIPEDTSLQFGWNKLKGKSFFVAHGTNDPVIPVTFARRSRELLSNTDAELEYHEYPMGHEIGGQSVVDLQAWFKKQIDR